MNSRNLKISRMSKFNFSFNFLIKFLRYISINIKQILFLLEWTLQVNQEATKKDQDYSQNNSTKGHSLRNSKQFITLRMLFVRITFSFGINLNQCH